MRIPLRGQHRPKQSLLLSQIHISIEQWARLQGVRILPVVERSTGTKQIFNFHVI